jgi:hypothetical protein
VADSESTLRITEPKENEREAVPANLSAAPGKASSSTSRPSLFSNVPQWLSLWVPIVTAIISLAISLYTLAVTTVEPEVLLIMPDQVRISQGAQSGPLLYVQPVFISTGLSERTEVITGIRLQVEAVDQSRSGVEFVWDEQGTWAVDPSTQNFNWVFAGDPGPFLVSPKNAQFFMGLFIGPSDWLFEPGTYRITMIADRITNSRSLNAGIEISLSAEDLDYLNQSQGTRFLMFPALE